MGGSLKVHDDHAGGLSNGERIGQTVSFYEVELALEPDNKEAARLGLRLWKIAQFRCLTPPVRVPRKSEKRIGALILNGAPQGPPGRRSSRGGRSATNNPRHW
jgi:hypothetical protein